MGSAHGNLRRLIEIRDDDALRTSAAGAKVVVEAVKVLELSGQERSGGVRVGVAVNIGGETPVYVIDLTSPGAGRACLTEYGGAAQSKLTMRN